MPKRPSIKERKEALRVVLGAKDVLRKRGWFGGDGVGDMDGGNSCALMALNEMATNGTQTNNDMTHYNRLASCMVLETANKIHDPRSRDERLDDMERIGRAAPIFDSIPDWNDSPHITKRKVQGVFTRVARQLYGSLPEKDRKGIKAKIKLER